MVIKKVQSIEINPLPVEAANIAKQILTEKFEGGIKNSTLFSIELQENMPGETEASVPIFYSEMENKKIGIFKSKDKTFAGFQLKF